MSTRSSQGGFTLPEVAIVVPMMILIVIALMGLLIAMVNDIAGPTKQSSLADSSDKVFDSIGSDVTNSSSFLSAVGAGFSDSNSSSYGSPPADTDVLIIQSYNQTKDPTDTTGTKTLPAFKGISPCATTSINKDNVVPIVIIYFVKDSVLWRRVLTATAPGSTCNTPLLIQQSCPSGGGCTNEDLPLTKATVTEFKVTYYSTVDSDTVAIDKSLAQSVLVSVKNSTPSGGSNAVNTSVVRLSRLSH